MSDCLGMRRRRPVVLWQHIAGRRSLTFEDHDGRLKTRNRDGMNCLGEEMKEGSDSC